jgi:hypothetical protein
MKYAIIENGVVTNVVVAEADYAAEQGWIDAGIAGIGWKYDGTAFTAPDPVPEPEPAPAPTKEQLMAELAALTAKIQALE